MIDITVIAVEKLKDLIAKENKGIKIPETAGLRLELLNKTPGLIKIEAAPLENDLIATSKGIRLFIDQDNQRHIKEKYPKGFLIFWIGGPVSEGFNIQDPNANLNYGCGRLANIE